MERLDHETLLEIATNVFELMLEIPVESVPASESAGVGSDYVSTICMSGSSNMQIELRAPLQTARDIAAKMFMEDGDRLSESDVRDALGEVTNMVGGGLKGLGDGDSQLALPSVATLAESGRQSWTPQATVLLNRQPLHFAWQLN